MQPETQFSLREGCYQPDKNRKFLEQYKELQSQTRTNPAWQELQGRNLSTIKEEEPNKVWKMLRRLEPEKLEKPNVSKAKEAERAKIAATKKAVTKDPLLQPTKKQRIIKLSDGAGNFTALY